MRAMKIALFLAQGPYGWNPVLNCQNIYIVQRRTRKDKIRQYPNWSQQPLCSANSTNQKQTLHIKITKADPQGLYQPV